MQAALSRAKGNERGEAQGDCNTHSLARRSRNHETLLPHPRGSSLYPNPRRSEGREQARVSP